MAQRLCLTIGDPQGIGPEITAKFLAQHWDGVAPLTVLGDITALEKAAEACHTTLPETQGVFYANTTDKNIGQTVYNALEAAVSQIALGQADALVTGPIAKFRLEEAGIEAHGHTEILEDLSRQYFAGQPANAQMLFVYRAFRLLLLTRHIPLRQVSDALSTQDNAAVLQTLIAFLRDTLDIAHPRLALLGVNPHAGELDGCEERDVLIPLRETLNATGQVHITGPYAADAFFRGFSAQEPGCDAIISPYHDQGLIPFKLLAGFDAVNVTIGLPFLRTSVSHGTAFDIAGQNLAAPDSLLAAVQFAIHACVQQKQSVATLAAESSPTNLR